MTKKLLTVKQYSDMMGVTQQSVYQKIKNNSIKYVVQDGKKFIETTEEIIKSIEESEKDPKELLIRELHELRKIVEEQYYEIKRLNKKLNKEKDLSINVLKQYIGEIKQLPSKPQEEIIIDVPTKKKKKKKKKSKK